MSRAVFSRCRCGVVVVVSAVVLFATLTGAAGIEAKPGTTSDMIASEDERFEMNIADHDGDEVAEIAVNGEVVIRIRSTMGGWTPAERGAIVLDRLRALSEDQEILQSLRPSRKGNYDVVGAGSAVVITIDPQTANANRTTTSGLARVWSDNLREAFGLPRLQYEQTKRWISMVASWYGDKFAGLRTASGEIFDPTQLTAAHPSLPFGTVLQVTYPPTGRTVTVTINDRGPHISGRDLDLSREAASRLGLLPHGVDSVQVAILSDVSTLE